MDSGTGAAVPGARRPAAGEDGGAPFLEMRVHGVSNTPPADLLGMPKVRPADDVPVVVAGDARTGFYRAPSPDARDAGVTVEVYSWGQLTSGMRAVKDIQRALWTLLLPFMLGNLAFHARPDIPADPKDETPLSRSGVSAFLVRLLCLSLTVFVVLGTAGVGVDLFAWQCVDRECLGQIPGPWEFLDTGWWHVGGRALVVGLLAPFLILGVIGLLTWRSYHYEAVVPTRRPDPDAPRPTHPMADPYYWSGEGQVRRLSVVHLTAGAAAAIVVPVAAVNVLDKPDGARGWAALAVIAGVAAVLALAVIALALPYVTRRGGDPTIGRYGWTMVFLAAATVVAGVLFLLLPEGGPNLAAMRPPDGCAEDATIAGCGTDRSLPGYDWIVAWFATGQFLLILAIAGVSRAGRRTLWVPALGAVLVFAGNLWSDGRTWGDNPRWGIPAAPPELHTYHFAAPIMLVVAVVTLCWPASDAVRAMADHKRGARLAWGGRGPAILAGLGWALALGYTAGLHYWVTDRLNRGATPTGQSSISPPVTMMWTGLAIMVALTFMLIGGVVTYRAFRRLRDTYLYAVDPDLSPHELRRARDVTTFQAVHDLVGMKVLRIVGWLAVSGLLCAVAGTSAVMSNRRPVDTDPQGAELILKAVVDVGDRLATLLPVLIAALGALVYRSDNVRRWVGVIWDVGVFWPRAAHPLGPPSYAETAVPQIQTRTRGLLFPTDPASAHPDRVVLAGHSQGSVILAAAILQMGEDVRRRVYLFTFGCQLTRLYGRVFPAHFGPARIRELSKALRVEADPRWTNFHRRTDPIGWQVDADQREIRVSDPTALRPNNGEVLDPPIRNHSGYPDAGEYRTERERVLSALVPEPPGAALPPDAVLAPHAVG